MKIICQSYEETRYRLDVLGNAVEKVDWHKNAIIIDSAYLASPQKFPAPATLKKIEEKIQQVKKLKSVGLFGDA